jgi:hypothetical protein
MLTSANNAVTISKRHTEKLLKSHFTIGLCSTEFPLNTLIFTILRSIILLPIDERFSKADNKTSSWHT